MKKNFTSSIELLDKSDIQQNYFYDKEVFNLDAESGVWSKKTSEDLLRIQLAPTDINLDSFKNRRESFLKLLAINFLHGQIIS